ncbi:MAG: hypothetical protein ACXADS_15300 [Candidatus Thorarchaeota archaeon]|jgi:hypothetical protein
MKRLFILREKKQGKPIPGMEFENKQDAKQKRDEMGGDTVVSLGPDHRNYNEPAKGSK